MRLIPPENSTGYRIITGIFAFLIPLLFLFTGQYIALAISLAFIGVIALLVYFRLEEAAELIVGIVFFGFCILVIFGVNS